MRRFIKLIKPPHVISALAVGGFAFAMLNGNSPPLFTNLDNFVLFAQEEVRIEKEVQVSSGDIGSNKKIDIEKDVVVNSNLFAKEIAIDKNSTVNGNASFNKLKLHKEAQILGTQTKPVQLPITNLPDIPDFQIGTQNFKFEGENNTLSAGSYLDIVLEKNGRLALVGGTYNIRKLELKDNAVLIFDAPTTINIQFKLRGHNKVSILPGLNLKPDDLIINYIGIKPKKDKKEEREDDDDEIESEMDDKEKRDHKAGKIGRPVVFGKNSFLNFKLLAPKAKVIIEKESILRGQVVAKKVRIGKGAVVSREESSIFISNPANIVESEDGPIFIVNEILIDLIQDATIIDAGSIVSGIDGKIIGFIEIINMYQIQVPVASESELDALIQGLRNSGNPKIERVFPNFLHSQNLF